MKKVESFISTEGRVVNETLNGCDYWWFEFGGSLDTIGDNQDITLELKRIALGVWNYIKNTGKFKADNLTLEWMGAVPGKRESRRFIGADVLKQQDVTEQRQFDDTVAYGGWFLDFHPAGGVYAAEANCIQIPVFAYTIPLRCLYHHDFPNILFAGRDISVSHAAFASSRIQNTCALTGHAAGAAAAYAVSQNRSPANFNAVDIHVLQQMITRFRDLSGTGKVISPGRPGFQSYRVWRSGKPKPSRMSIADSPLTRTGFSWLPKKRGPQIFQS
jgi:hypothetical protein